MEQTEEMMILKSDIAIVVKKDGTTLISSATDHTSFIALFEGIAEWLEKADKAKVAEYCLSELIGRQAIRLVLKNKLDELGTTQL